MARARKTAQPAKPAAKAVASAGSADVDDQAKQDQASPNRSNENRSEQVLVVPPAEEEPVRAGGWVLTENGWVTEDQPVPEATAEVDSAEEQE